MFFSQVGSEKNAVQSQCHDCPYSVGTKHRLAPFTWQLNTSLHVLYWDCVTKCSAITMLYVTFHMSINQIFFMLTNQIFCMSINQTFCMSINQIFCMSINQIYCKSINKFFCVSTNKKLCKRINQSQQDCMKDAASCEHWSVCLQHVTGVPSKRQQNCDMNILN